MFHSDGKLFASTVFIAIIFQMYFVPAAKAQTVLAKFGNSKITVNEFKKEFLKNQNEKKISKKDSSALRDFLKLYVNFKMKLLDAKDRGFASNSEIQSEVNNYQKEVGVPYYLQKYIKDPAIKKLYNESKYELRVSHILISPKKSTYKAAEDSAWAIIKKLKQGADFAVLAKKYSDDKRSAVNGGDIYWLTAGQVITPFEKAIYSTNPGHIYPKPVKTRFGYHIIKVVAKQKRIPKIRVSHILIGYKNDSGKVDTAAALAKIKKIKAELDKGADFGELAIKYSEDKGSAAKKGDLGIIQRRMMVKPFDEAAFKLKVGEISGIVKTRYGFHIIKKTAEEKFPTFTQEKKRLTQLYDRRDFQHDLRNLLEQLKAKNNYFKIDTVDKILTNENKKVTFGDDYWRSELHEKLKKLPVCSINGRKILSDVFFKSAQNFPHINGTVINVKNYNRAYSKFEQNLLILQKVKEIAKNDSTFRQLMKEFRDGIYIFKLQDKEVWNKLKVDSTKLKSLYEKNKSKYMWKDRVSFIELYRFNLDSLKAFADSVKNGEDFAELAARKTKRSKRLVKNGFYNLVGVNSSEMAAKAFTMKKGKISGPLKLRRGWSLIKLVDKEPRHQKSYKEALPEVSNLYQDLESKKLENQYLNRLKLKYHPVIFYSKLKDVFDSQN